jgi:tRNA uridine 5-carboxymethylaminomethyl modification enzyme
LGQEITHEYSLADLIRRPEMSYQALVAAFNGRWQAEKPLDRDLILVDQVAEQVEIGIKYQGYIDRQATEIARQAYYEELQLPKDLDYGLVTGLSKEVQQKLNKHRPMTLGQASRVSGITPAAISLLLIHLKKGLGRKPMVKQ